MIESVSVVSEMVLATAPKSALLTRVVILNREQGFGLARFVTREDERLL